MTEKTDVLIIGAGAAGMMCAIEAGKRGRKVILLDHAKAPGEKIRISGGGRCNFTNVRATAKNFLSVNPHFAKSALARYSPRDFIDMVERHNIAWHEKALGQLFCDDSAKDIIRMLLTELRQAGAALRLGIEVQSVEKIATGFRVATHDGPIEAVSLVVASGGKSIPKMGATGFAYKIAEQFGLSLIETRPGLVPLTLDPLLLEKLAPLSGIAVEAVASHGKSEFREALLFTHRGISGPAVLQISSFWREGDDIRLRLLPDVDILASLKGARKTNGKQALQTALGDIMPKRLAQFFGSEASSSSHLADQSDKALAAVKDQIQSWQIRPAGSEGYRTAEVTIGGVDTAMLDSRSMESKSVPSLYFIGECVDVTGWLGGYNFQWAWSSGFVAGQAA